MKNNPNMLEKTLQVKIRIALLKVGAHESGKYRLPESEYLKYKAFVAKHSK